MLFDEEYGASKHPMGDVRGPVRLWLALHAARLLTINRGSLSTMLNYYSYLPAQVVIGYVFTY